jgi:hypothetical protein
VSVVQGRTNSKSKAKAKAKAKLSQTAKQQNSTTTAETIPLHFRYLIRLSSCAEPGLVGLKGVVLIWLILFIYDNCIYIYIYIYFVNAASRALPLPVVVLDAPE